MIIQEISVTAKCYTSELYSKTAIVFSSVFSALLCNHNKYTSHNVRTALTNTVLTHNSCMNQCNNEWKVMNVTTFSRIKFFSASDSDMKYLRNKATKHMKMECRYSNSLMLFI